jgi:hypothetical protein
LSRAGVQLVCIFRFFFAIVVPPCAGAAPCGAHRRHRPARARPPSLPRAGAAFVRPGKDGRAGSPPLCTFSLRCVTRIYGGAVAELRRATCGRGALGPGSALAHGGVRHPRTAALAGPGHESGAAKQSLVSRASAAKRNETRDPAREGRSAILFSPTCRCRPLGPGSALAGGRTASSLYRGARWAGTRER